MPRKPRIDFAGAWHHVMHRGARRAPIFHENRHCELFLEILAEAVEATELEVHAYSLMSNHYHLLVRSRHGNLSKAMKRLNANTTQRLNALHQWDGPVFRGRFRSQLVEDEASLPYLLAYLHLDPLRARLVTRLQSATWTSHRVYLGRDKRPPWLETGYFAALFDGDMDRLHGYVLDLHCGERSWPEAMAMDSGWLRQSGERASLDRQATVETRFVSEREAITRICSLTGADEATLRKRVYGPRANPARRFAAWALSRSTRLTHREIGSLLDMSVSQVSHVLRRIRFKEPPLSEWHDGWIESEQVSDEES